MIRRSSWLVQRIVAQRSGLTSSRGYSASDLGVASGAPLDTYDRKVVIYAPSRSPTQQGQSKTQSGPNSGQYPAWRIEFSTKQKWENPLMGWTSTGDQLEHVARSGIWFWTQEQAENYCKSHGFEYEVQPPNVRSTKRSKRFASYGNNFSTQRGGIPSGGLRSEGGEEK